GLLTGEGFPALAEVRDTGLRKARNFLSERCAVGRQRPPLHDRLRPYLATTRSISKPMCGPPMSGRFTTPMTHTLLDSRPVASPADARFCSDNAAENGDF